MAVKPDGAKSAAFCTLNDEEGFTLIVSLIVACLLPPNPIIGTAMSAIEVAMAISGSCFGVAIFYLIVHIVELRAR